MNNSSVCSATQTVIDVSLCERLSIFFCPPQMFSLWTLTLVSLRCKSLLLLKTVCGSNYWHWRWWWSLREFQGGINLFWAHRISGVRWFDFVILFPFMIYLWIAFIPLSESLLFPCPCIGITIVMYWFIPPNFFILLVLWHVMDVIIERSYEYERRNVIKYFVFFFSDFTVLIQPCLRK